MALEPPVKINYQKLDDATLIGIIIDNGNRRAMGELYERYANKVYHKCLSMVKDKSTAQDLTHDILVKAFTKLSTIKNRSLFSYWLFKTTYTTCLKHFAKIKKEAKVVQDEFIIENIPLDEAEKEDMVLKEMRLDQLEKVFDQLRPKEKMIMLMRYQDEMSVKDIANTLAIGESAVKMRMKRGREKLAQLIKELENEHE